MAKKAIKAPPRFIKLDEVKRITTLSDSEIYRRVASGAFPKQISVGKKSVVWVEQEVMAWVDLMISGRDVSLLQIDA